MEYSVSKPASVSNPPCDSPSAAGMGPLHRWAEAVRDLFGAAASDNPRPETHLTATMEWLRAAQDATPDGGVARMYDMRSGWGASYPETTGYIIPTFLAYARAGNRQEYRDRALRMADWESRVQMPEGAVQGGTVADPPSPAIFNTGQALFGWIAAYRDSGRDRYLESLERAAEYLVEMQDGDGLWRRNLSAFCSAPVDTYAYNARTAWALIKAAEVTGSQQQREAGAANLHAVAQMANDRGWIANNCLTDPSAPLLHTIAYTFQGLLEGGHLLGEQRLVDLVVRGNRALRLRFHRDGRLYGRYDANWDPTVRWRCLTGEAQTAIVWHRLAELTEPEWRADASRIVDGLNRTQRLAGPEGLAGGIKGSFPVFGWYGKYQLLNWAAKFHADALMLELEMDGAAVDG